jgi:hypothetical protein
MPSVRRLLGRHIVAWLLCQTAMLVLEPVAFAMAPAGSERECTCAHGEHAICPMHHPLPEDPTHCRLSSAAGHDTAALATALAVAGVVPASAPIASLPRTPVRATLTVAPALRRTATPDPPPPRV